MAAHAARHRCATPERRHDQGYVFVAESDPMVCHEAYGTIDCGDQRRYLCTVCLWGISPHGRLDDDLGLELPLDSPVGEHDAPVASTIGAFVREGAENRGGLAHHEPHSVRFLRQESAGKAMPSHQRVVRGRWAESGLAAAPMHPVLLHKHFATR